MKTIRCLFVLLALGLCALAGCGKSEQASGPATEFYGVKVDLAKLDSEFANAASDVHSRAVNAKTFFRYGQFARALTELEQFSQMPGLTDPQKKALNTVIEQTKQVIAKMPAPTGK